MLTADRFLMVDTVRAKRRIEDSPLARDPAPAKRGTTGTVEDSDALDDLVYVDFGHGAIACLPDELTILVEQPRGRNLR